MMLDIHDDFLDFPVVASHWLHYNKDDAWRMTGCKEQQRLVMFVIDPCKIRWTNRDSV